VTETGKMGWVKHVAYMMGTGSSYKCLLEKLKERDHSGRLSLETGIIIYLLTYLLTELSPS
jgi:hypothetical protein